MKKNFANLLSLVLALALMLSLVGCGSDSQVNAEYGTKTPTTQNTDVEENIEETPSQENEYDKNSIDGEWMGVCQGEYIGVEVEYSVEMTFYDGECVLTISKDSLADAFRSAFENKAAEENLDPDELVQQKGYDDLDDYVTEWISQFDASMLVSRGEYEFDGYSLVVDGEETDFKYDGETLELEIQCPTGAAKVLLERV